MYWSAKGRPWSRSIRCSLPATCTRKSSPQDPHSRRRREPDDLDFSLAKGAAVALNPIPVADMAGGLAVDVGMIVTLSKVYGIPLTRRTASGLVKDMMVALGTLGAVEIAVRLVASGVKSSLAGLTVLTGGWPCP